MKYRSTKKTMLPTTMSPYFCHDWATISRVGNQRIAPPPLRRRGAAPLERLAHEERLQRRVARALAHEVGEAALGGDQAAVQDHHAVAQALHVGEDVRREQDRRAAAVELADE